MMARTFIWCSTITTINIDVILADFSTVCYKCFLWHRTNTIPWPEALIGKAILIVILTSCALLFLFIASSCFSSSASRATSAEEGNDLMVVSSLAWAQNRIRGRMGPGQVHSQHDCLDSSWLEKFLVMLAVLLIVTLLNCWMATIAKHRILCQIMLMPMSNYLRSLYMFTVCVASFYIMIAV